MCWLRCLIAALMLIHFSLGFEATGKTNIGISTKNIKQEFSGGKIKTVVPEEKDTSSRGTNESLTTSSTSEASNASEVSRVCSHVALIYMNGTSSCNGVFLSRSTVLTVASEFVRFSNLSEVNMTVKVRSVYCDDPSGPGRDYPVEWVYFHPLYMDSKLERYNLALLNVVNRVDIPETSLVEVASNQDPPESTIRDPPRCHLLGYSVFGNQIAPNMTGLEVTSKSDCQELMTSLNRTKGFSFLYHACARSPQTDIYDVASFNDCWAERGSSLICDNKLNGLLVGYGKSCRDKIFLRTDLHGSFCRIASTRLHQTLCQASKS